MKWALIVLSAIVVVVMIALLLFLYLDNLVMM